jgi:ABC-type phosphate/phosphonate transport system substrate-binding protein
MRANWLRFSVWLAVFGVVSAAGCHAPSLRFLSAVGLSEQPLGVALVTDKATVGVLQAINPFPPYASLRKALSEHLGRPVGMDVCFTFQVGPLFSTKVYDMAIVTPEEYSRLDESVRSRVVAVSVDAQGRMARSALLVVAADSDLREIADLGGKVVAFGPAGDSRSHYAALRLLERAGLKKSDLALEPLPLPGSLKHMPDGKSVALSIISGKSAAGFIDEADWERFPEHSTDTGVPARDRLRVIGRTAALPDQLFIAAAHVDELTFERVRSFLLAVGDEQPEAVEKLGVAGYRVPTEDVLEACSSITQPAASEEAEEAESPVVSK